METQNGGQASTSSSEEFRSNLKRHLGHLGWWFLVCILGGLAIAAIMAEWKWGTAVLWGLGCLASGFLVGCIFGLPRTADVDTSSTKDKPSGSGEVRRLTVNTNLEQISDWVTKIIVGVSLVEAQAIKQNFISASRFLGGCLSTDCGEALAGGIILYHSVLGLLGGYLAMRMYFSPLFGIADYETGSSLSPDDKRTVEENARPSVDEPTAEVSPSTQSALHRIGQLSLDTLSTATDLQAWARAQLHFDHPVRALKGYERAIDASPSSVELRVERAVAQNQASIDPKIIYDGLLEARELALRKGANADTWFRLYNTLVYTCLFLPPPMGFEEAIKFGEEYLKRPNVTSFGAILVNLACAYGQKAAWNKAHGLSTEEKTATGISLRERALELAKLAIQDNAQWKDRIAELLEGRSPDMDDLKVFNDEGFRRELGL
jgi:hypothetical protein